MSISQVTPWGIRKSLGWAWDQYKAHIFVTENGYSTKLNNLDDLYRSAQLIKSNSTIQE